MSEPEEPEHQVEIPRGAFLLLILFLIAVAASWTNVYLTVLGRA